MDPVSNFFLWANSEKSEADCTALNWYFRLIFRQIQARSNFFQVATDRSVYLWPLSMAILNWPTHTKFDMDLSDCNVYASLPSIYAVSVIVRRKTKEKEFHSMITFQDYLIMHSVHWDGRLLTPLLAWIADFCQSSSQDNFNDRQHNDDAKYSKCLIFLLSVLRLDVFLYKPPFVGAVEVCVLMSNSVNRQ